MPQTQYMSYTRCMCMYIMKWKEELMERGRSSIESDQNLSSWFWQSCTHPPLLHLVLEPHLQAKVGGSKDGKSMYVAILWFVQGGTLFSRRGKENNSSASYAEAHIFCSLCCMYGCNAGQRRRGRMRGRRRGGWGEEGEGGGGGERGGERGGGGGGGWLHVFVPEQQIGGVEALTLARPSAWSAGTSVGIYTYSWNRQGRECWANKLISFFLNV